LDGAATPKPPRTRDALAILPRLFDSFKSIFFSFFPRKERNKKGNSSSPYFSGSYSPEPKHIVCVCVRACWPASFALCHSKSHPISSGGRDGRPLAANPLQFALLLRRATAYVSVAECYGPCRPYCFFIPWLLLFYFLLFFCVTTTPGVGQDESKGQRKSSKWIFQESKEKRKKLEEQNVVFFHSSSSFLCLRDVDGSIRFSLLVPLHAFPHGVKQDCRINRYLPFNISSMVFIIFYLFLQSVKKTLVGNWEKRCSSSQDFLLNEVKRPEIETKGNKRKDGKKQEGLEM
jgi:hypothetical protein